MGYTIVRWRHSFAVEVEPNLAIGPAAKLKIKAVGNAYLRNSHLSIKLTLAVLAISPLVLSAQVRIVAPDWTGLNAPYIEDPVPVQIAVDRSGSAVFLNAPDPLPDNVVSSIEQSRFNEKQFLAKNVELTIVVRRALTEGRERLLMPDWAHPDDVNQLRAAQKYSEKEVTRLERKAEHSEDEQTFASLLAYYTLSPAPDSYIAGRRRAELISWFVRNEPESDLLGTTYAMINTKGGRFSDPAAFAKIAAEWQAAVTAHPENPYILRPRCPVPRYTRFR